MMREPLNINRRDALARMGAGMGALGLFNALHAQTAAKPHFTPRAKRVIHLFMNGGPFQADLFDPKPALAKYAGRGQQKRVRPPFFDLVLVSNWNRTIHYLRYYLLKEGKGLCL